MEKWEYRSTHSSCWHCVKVTDASCSVHFTAYGGSPQCSFNRGLGGDLVCIMEKRKLSCPYRQLNFLSHAACSLDIELTEVSKFTI